LGAWPGFSSSRCSRCGGCCMTISEGVC
jgi:hypothetical protein